MPFRVPYMLLADQVQELGAGKTNILGTFDQFQPPTLPFMVPGFFMVALLVSDNEDTIGDHKLSHRLTRPDGRLIAEGGGSLKIMPKPGTWGIAATRIIIGFQNVPLKEVGKHKLALLVDDVEVASHPFNVAVGPQAHQG